MLTQDPHDLGGGARWFLPLQRRSQLQNLRRGPQLGRSRCREQRFEPTASICADPTIQAHP